MVLSSVPIFVQQVTPYRGGRVDEMDAGVKGRSGSAAVQALANGALPRVGAVVLRVFELCCV